MMTSGGLAIWVGGVLVVQVLGGLLPLLLSRRRSEWLPVALAISAGIMLGAALLHLMPEAFAILGEQAGVGVLSGFVFLYIFERFITIHICETHDCAVHSMGLSAMLGLSVHTLANGVALGAGWSEGMGGVVFFALAAHKLPESFSLTSILLHEHYSRSRILLMNLLFMMMIPLGAWLVPLTGTLFGPQLGAWAVAFSAGTFLHVAVSDLLPAVHNTSSRHHHLVLAFLSGVGIVSLINSFVH